MRDQDLVSIVIPAYNVESTIAETLESVVAQTYGNIEVIVIDDGSTDRTLDVVKRFIKNKSHINVHTKGNEGLAATRNYGFQFVRGKYLLFLDADDLIDSQFVELCLDIFNSQPHVDIVTTEIQHFERENNIFAHSEFSRETILRKNCFVITSMIKSDAFREIGMFDETMRFHEDWEMWIRMTQKYHHVVRINKPLFWYRKRESEDSLCDLSSRNSSISDEAHLHLYLKHYQWFRDFGYGVEDLFKKADKEIYYRHKYNRVWYRRLFYRLFKNKKLD